MFISLSFSFSRSLIKTAKRNHADLRSTLNLVTDGVPFLLRYLLMNLYGLSDLVSCSLSSYRVSRHQLVYRIEWEEFRIRLKPLTWFISLVYGSRFHSSMVPVFTHLSWRSTLSSLCLSLFAIRRPTKGHRNLASSLPFTVFLEPGSWIPTHPLFFFSKVKLNRLFHWPWYLLRLVLGSISWDSRKTTQLAWKENYVLFKILARWDLIWMYYFLKP